MIVRLYFKHLVHKTQTTSTQICCCSGHIVLKTCVFMLHTNPDLLLPSSHHINHFHLWWLLNEAHLEPQILANLFVVWISSFFMNSATFFWHWKKLQPVFSSFMSRFFCAVKKISKRDRQTKLLYIKHWCWQTRRFMYPQVFRRTHLCKQ